MALSKVTYTGNGSTQTFSLTFNYLNKSHVKAYVNGVEDTGITWPTTSTVTLSSPPANGTIVVFQRVTPTTPIVDFVDGSNLTEAMLDTATRQGIYIAEENKDATTESVTLDIASDTYLFNNKRLANVANPVNAQDVVTKGFLDSTYVSSLNAIVASATTQANIATTQAGIATTKANEASASASSAASSAASASTSATNAANSAAQFTKATQAQAEAGTDNTTYTTPLRVAQAINALAPQPLFQCRAWAQFNGSSSAGAFSGGASTVYRAAGSTTATITTTTPHNLITGNRVYANSGVAAGNYVVTTLTDTTFTITTVATTLLNNVTITFLFCPLNGGGNVNSVAYLGASSYYVNLSTPMVDTAYAAISNSPNVIVSSSYYITSGVTGYETSGFNVGGVVSNMGIVSVAVFK